MKRLLAILLIAAYPVLAMAAERGNRAGSAAPSEAEAQGPPAGAIVSASFEVTPLVRKTAEGERQVLYGTVVTGEVDRLRCTLTQPGWAEPQVVELGGLPAGEHRIELLTPRLTEPATGRIVLETAQAELVLEDVNLAAPRHWTINLVQHTHTDIGYTRPQHEVLPKHLQYIDYALDYCDLTDAYPDDAKFRWTCETTWAVQEYLACRPPEQIERLKRRIAEGRIELTGMFLNMSEIATESSLARSLMPIKGIEEALDTSITTAMQNDVNGAAWCLADYFDAIGVKYLTMGINKTRSLVPFDRNTVFWWESPSGKRVLAHLADHYHTGNMWGIHEGDLAAFERKVAGYLLDLERRDYPFDALSIQYSGYSIDNSPPAMKEMQLIREWNERYASPRLHSATASEFLRDVAENHADTLPVYRQAWPDWWTDGFGSAARETAVSRQTHAALQATETLMSMAALLGAAPSPSVANRLGAAQRNLLFYDEHTFGADASVQDPFGENSMIQWGEKSAFVWEAAKEAALAREEAIGAIQEELPRASVPTLAVFNTLNWKRSGLVEVFIDRQFAPPDKGLRILDPDDNTAIPARALGKRQDGSYWALWVSDVPALGYKSYRIETTDAAVEAAAESATDSGVLENEFYRIEMDVNTGGVRQLIEKRTGRQLVDTSAPWQLGQILSESIIGRDTPRKQEGWQYAPLSGVKLKAGAEGPIWKSVLIEGNLAGAEEGRGVRAEIRLYDAEPIIEFHFSIRKLSVTSPEATYVAFPFAIPQGELYYEAQGGTVRPGIDQLPRSSWDWQTVQNYIALRGSDGQVIFGSEGVPLVQFGDLNFGKWQETVSIERPVVYSWVMNNYWFTNFRATQEGEFRWSYYITSTSDTSNSAATRFGSGARVEMFPRVLPPGSPNDRLATMSCMNIDHPNMLLVDAHPAIHSNAIVLHLRECEGAHTTLDMGQLLPHTKAKAVHEVNALEEALGENRAAVSFAPYEAKFIRLMLK